MQKNRTIFGKFNLSSTANKHLNGALWPKIGLENLLQTFSRIDIDT